MLNPVNWSSLDRMTQFQTSGPPRLVSRAIDRGFLVAMGIVLENLPNGEFPDEPSQVGLVVSVTSPDVPLKRPKIWRQMSETQCEWEGEGYWCGMMARELLSEWLAMQGFHHEAKSVLVRQPGVWVCVNDPNGAHVCSGHMMFKNSEVTLAMMS